MKIGITYRYAKDPTGKRNRLYIPGEFKRIFDELNVTLIPIVSEAGLDDIVDICDALIVPGSYADTPPHYYHEEPMQGKIYDVDEYAYDSKVIEKFYKQHKPILGVCGGHQEINVYFGGTLHQRIEGHDGDFKHKANIKENSFIYNIYKNKQIDVNTWHFQAVKDVAPGFVASAISEDGIVEAIEKDNIVCVQWHPEMLHDIDFFKAFISLIK